MINKIIGILTFLIGYAIYFFRSGKSSVENKQNKKIVKNVKIRNNIIKDTSSISDSDIDIELQKWKRPVK